jgi:hypothetical protein
MGQLPWHLQLYRNPLTNQSKTTWISLPDGVVDGIFHDRTSTKVSGQCNKQKWAIQKNTGVSF